MSNTASLSVIKPDRGRLREIALALRRILAESPDRRGIYFRVWEAGSLIFDAAYAGAFHDPIFATLRRDLEKSNSSSSDYGLALRVCRWLEGDPANKLSPDSAAIRQRCGVMSQEYGTAVITALARLVETVRHDEQANTAVVFSGAEPTADVKDLAFRLASRGDKSKMAIALEFTHGNEQKAKSLLAQIRRLKAQGRIKFSPV